MTSYHHWANTISSADLSGNAVHGVSQFQTLIDTLLLGAVILDVGQGA